MAGSCNIGIATIKAMTHDLEEKVAFYRKPIPPQEAKLKVAPSTHKGSAFPSQPPVCIYGAQAEAGVPPAEPLPVSFNSAEGPTPGRQGTSLRRRSPSPTSCKTEGRRDSGTSGEGHSQQALPPASEEKQEGEPRTLATESTRAGAAKEQPQGQATANSTKLKATMEPQARAAATTTAGKAAPFDNTRATLHQLATAEEVTQDELNSCSGELVELDKDIERLEAELEAKKKKRKSKVKEAHRLASKKEAQFLYMKKIFSSNEVEFHYTCVGSSRNKMLS